MYYIKKWADGWGLHDDETGDSILLTHAEFLDLKTRIYYFDDIEKLNVIKI